MEIASNKWSNRVPPLDLSGVSVYSKHTDCCWTNLHKTPSVMAKKSWQISSYRIDSDDLPIDPRDWTRAHVWKWLHDLTTMEGLTMAPDIAEKFPMNGKALCLMSLDMYLNRVPVGGKTLYRDFQLRMARAVNL
ncbi:ETS-domain lacking [Sergentomyia squamirostris]